MVPFPLFFLFVSVLSQALLALVGRHFVFLSFLTARHTLCVGLEAHLFGCAMMNNYLSKSFRYESAVACTAGSGSSCFTFSNCWRAFPFCPSLA